MFPSPSGWWRLKVCSGADVGGCISGCILRVRAAAVESAAHAFQQRRAHLAPPSAEERLQMAPRTRCANCVVCGSRGACERDVKTSFAPPGGHPCCTPSGGGGVRRCMICLHWFGVTTMSNLPQGEGLAILHR